MVECILCHLGADIQVVIKVDTGVNDMPESSEQGLMDPGCTSEKVSERNQCLNLSLRKDKNDCRGDDERAKGLAGSMATT